MQSADFIIIGAGIAGASLAYHIGRQGKTIILEREDQPGYHSTGRSAAVYNSNYGPRLMRVMSKASGPFFFDPPAGFTDTPLLKPLGVMFVARQDQAETLSANMAVIAELTEDMQPISITEANERAPILRPGYVAAAAYDDSTKDMDVNAIHSGYLRGAKKEGVSIVTDAQVTALIRNSDRWYVQTKAGEFQAPVVVNAAGAWADQIGELAGARTIGLVPKRRTAIVVDAPEHCDLSTWCAVADAEEQWYYKPDAGQILASPADETPVPAQDIQPDELDIATLVDRLQRATSLDIKRINRSWAGLRSFVEDHCPVVGFAPDRAGFFWLAGQGGYGIQTSYAMGKTAAALIQGNQVPEEITKFGVTSEQLGPMRLWRD